MDLVVCVPLKVRIPIVSLELNFLLTLLLYEMRLVLGMLPPLLNRLMLRKQSTLMSLRKLSQIAQMLPPSLQFGLMGCL